MKKVVRVILAISLINIVISILCPTNSSAESISIDGYFDDWEGIPSTDIYYDDSSDQQWHKGSFVIKDGYIYVCINLAPDYRSQVPTNEYRINVNGNTAVANINFSDSNGNIDYSKGGKLRNLKNGVTTGLNVFIGYYPMYNVGNAAVKIVKGNTKNSTNDMLEFSMSVSQLEEILNLPANSIENGSKVEITNPNLGTQSIISVGTSTGTYVGIGICVLAVILLRTVMKKRNRRHEPIRDN